MRTRLKMKVRKKNHREQLIVIAVASDGELSMASWTGLATMCSFLLMSAPTNSDDSHDNIPRLSSMTMYESMCRIGFNSWHPRLAISSDF
jgi:hypothetical protein